MAFNGTLVRELSEPSHQAKFQLLCAVTNFCAVHSHLFLCHGFAEHGSFKTKDWYLVEGDKIHTSKNDRSACNELFTCPYRNILTWRSAYCGRGIYEVHTFSHLSSSIFLAVILARSSEEKWKYCVDSNNFLGVWWRSLDDHILVAKHQLWFPVSMQ